MSARYDLYMARDSWLHRRDPRSKLLFVICLSTLLLLLVNVWVMLAALLLTHALLWSARISRARLGWVWRITLPTMLLITVLWVVFYPGQGPALLSFWFVRVTAHNLAQGAAMALRISALAFTLFVLLFTTDPSSLVRGLVALGLPYDWGLTLAMALRYLPTMAGAFRMISEAQQARALDLSVSNPLKRARAYLPIVVAMLITALRTAENLGRALESRALGASRRRTALRRLRLLPADWLWMLVTLALTTLLLYARFALGLAADPLWPVR